MKVSASDGRKILWGVVKDHVVEEGKKHEEIGYIYIYYIYHIPYIYTGGLITSNRKSAS